MVLDWAGGLKPSVVTLLMVTVMAIVGITLAKWLVTKFPVPGLTEIVNMA